MAWIKNCYYLKGSSKQGSFHGDENGHVEPLAENMMKYPASFKKFDFENIWEVDINCSYQFPQLKNNRIIRIESVDWISYPIKDKYVVGEKIDLNGAKIVVKYEDWASGTEIPVTNNMLGEYDMTTAGEKQIEVDYFGNKIVFGIQVESNSVTEVNKNQNDSLVNVDKCQNDVDFELEQGETMKLVVKKSYDKKYKSSNKEVATVSSKGIITAKGPGIVKISIYEKSNGKKIEEITVKVIGEDEPDFELVLGKSERLTIKKGYSLVSSDKKIATVTNKNKVNAKRTGVVTLFLYNNEELIDKYIVKVVKA